MIYFVLGISITFNVIAFILLFTIFKKQKDILAFNNVTEDFNIRKDFLGF